jgi:hypothetical protein
MPNLIRLKQIDKPELSGYVKEITDSSYYPNNNPSGYISSVSSDSAFALLSGNLISSGSNLNSQDLSISGYFVSTINNTGSNLQGKIDSLSGVVGITNNDLSVISGLSNSAIYLVTGLEFETSGVISGEVATLNSTITGASGVLDTKINNVSGSLNSRVSVLENNFATTGSNFVDLNSNGQTIEGTKAFNNRISFKQIDLIPYTGNYSNPGGLNQILFTQFTDNYAFTASGYGPVTGDLFVTKVMLQNNVECILSSIIYTGSY